MRRQVALRSKPKKGYAPISQRCPDFLAFPMIDAWLVLHGLVAALNGSFRSRTVCRIRRHAGRELVKAIGPYRNRNAYVVANGDRIITIAYSPVPLFH